MRKRHTRIHEPACVIIIVTISQRLRLGSVIFTVLRSKCDSPDIRAKSARKVR